MFDFEEIFPSGSRVMLTLKEPRVAPHRYQYGRIWIATDYGIIVEPDEDKAETELTLTGLRTVGTFFSWSDIDDMLIGPDAGSGEFDEVSNVWADNLESMYPQPEKALAADSVPEAETVTVPREKWELLVSKMRMTGADVRREIEALAEAAD